MNLSIIARFVLIALVAGFAAWLPVALVFAVDANGGMPLSLYLALLAVAMLGSFAVGLPVAMLTFHLSWKHLVKAPATLATIAILASVMMMLTSFVLLGEEGLYALGLPSVIAAATFGLLGWHWILKPIGDDTGSIHV